MTKTKWSDGAWRDEDSRPVCVHCDRILDGHYTICIHCKTHLSRSQMDASVEWDQWNRERFARASSEQDEAKRRAILNERFTAQERPVTTSANIVNIGGHPHDIRCPQTGRMDVFDCCKPMVAFTATMEERERCAKIAESMAIPGHNVAAPLVAEIAKRIRQTQERSTDGR